MSRRHSRGSAGTLRRLGPRPGSSRRRAHPTALCHVRAIEGYLWARSEEGDPLFSSDPMQALPLVPDAARQVAHELRNQGYDAEVVPAPRGGGG